MPAPRRLGFSFLYFTPRVVDEHLAWLPRLAEHGYDGAEFPVSEATDAELTAIARRLRACGLESTAVGFVTPEANPVDPDAAVRRAAVERLRVLADRAAAIGARVLAGPIHSAYGAFTERPPDDDERARAADVLRAGAEYAESVGVTLGVEPLNRFECYFLNTAADCAALVEAVGHDALRGVLDTHHAHLEEDDLPGAVHAMGNGILGHVQLSENHRGTPGRGQVDFPAVLRALDEIEYDGWLVVEAFSRQDPGFGSALRIWRALDGGPEEVLAAGARLVGRGA